MYVSLALHVLYILICMWGAPYILFIGFDACRRTKLIAWWLALMFGQFVHWKLLKNECVLSLLEKKLKNPEYVMGSDPGNTHVWKLFSTLFCVDTPSHVWQEFHYKLSKMNIVVGLSMLTIGNECLDAYRVLRAITFVVTSYLITEYLEQQRNQNKKSI